MWQPIETAPKDGTEILALGIYDNIWDYSVIWYNKYSFDPQNCWSDCSGRNSSDKYYKYWQPLPKPPPPTDN